MDENGSMVVQHSNNIRDNSCESELLVNLSDDAALEEKLKQLQSELDECRSLVTVAECQKENAIETEQRKCHEEIASIQRIMEESVSEAVRNTSGHFEKEISQLQKTNEKLKAELIEIKSKAEKPDFSKEGVLAAVTKSLKRVSNISTPLPFTNAGESTENLEEGMKKVHVAQEDAEMLSSLIVPLEEEIKALKDKLRSTDEQLRNYESAFGTLVKSLGCDSLAQKVKGKGPSEVIEHLDEKLTALSQGLQAEKASRSDLEMYVAVLNTQKTVMQEDVDQIKKEFQEVYELLEKEKKEHGSLKRTWQMANDQFLETQRLQTMDMIRIQNVLTSEQQRQISELKKKDEERLEIERLQQQKTEKNSNLTKNHLFESSKPLITKKTPTKIHRRVPSNQSRHSTDGNLLSPIDPTSMRAQSIPANLNQTPTNITNEKRSLSSSALSKISSPPCLVNQSPSPILEPAMLPVTPTKSHCLTHDQLVALSDLTPELEVRRSLIDSARAETECFSLVGKRLVSETEWQLLEEELKNAREKFGQPCEMCCNYELQLQQVQAQEQEQRQRATCAEQSLDNYKKDLLREQEYRKDVEQKFSDAAKDCEKKVGELFKRNEEMDKEYQQQKTQFETHEKRVYEYQDTLHKERESLKVEVCKLQQENRHLLGKHLDKAQQMRNQEIELPNTVEELQFYALQKQEELITIVASKENMEENLKSELQMLKSQLISDQTAKEQLEDTLMQEIDSLREQLGIAESQKMEFELQSTHMTDVKKKIVSLQEDIERKEKIITELQNKVNNLTCVKNKLEEDLHELKSKVQSLQSDLDNSEAVQKDFVKLSQSLQMELEKIRQSDCEVRWQHDEDVPECNSCKKLFHGRKEKAHCNHCGKIFCLDCTSKSVCSGPNHRQFRVCNVCHTLLDRDTAPYFSCEPPQSLS